MKGGVFFHPSGLAAGDPGLRKTPLDCAASVYSNSGTAVADRLPLLGRRFCIDEPIAVLLALFFSFILTKLRKALE
jgi:hypothetical protein